MSVAILRKSLESYEAGRQVGRERTGLEQHFAGSQEIAAVGVEPRRATFFE
jgi:hypothetical protein